ncbi:hypothetical protein FKW77_007699 [Venturia effusa]|uniref:Uncharacterized protein n=1 Tax=Venturia effusa TaxID=50376 RepID=A0A517LB86_9PEZI|nr:hypothetical protein FKW77_007699 [Venturia effusa]
MGNGQSTVEDRSPGRVAKPKGFQAGKNSGGSSPASKQNTSSIGFPYSQYNDSESAAGSPTERNVELNQEFRQHIRSQLISSDEYDPAVGKGGEKVDVLAVSLARSLSRSGPGTANAPTPEPSASKLKLGSTTSQMSLSSERTVDLETAVALLQELRKTATPEDLVALHRALLPTRPIEQSNTDGLEDRFGISAAGLIRRKSLARPGIATRLAKKELKPEPKQNGQVWNTEMMGTSPLAQLSSLDNLECDLQPPTAIAQNRAHTPTGDEYTNLGNLKRGSLMVMNGSASPAPSFISRDLLVGRPTEEEYYTASENASPSASPARALPALPVESGDQSIEDFLLPDQQDQSADVSTKRSGSPLKREFRAESPIWESERETDSLMARQPQKQPSAISLIARSENHSLFSNVSSEEDLPAHSRGPHTRTVSQSAISLAAEYMLELPPSPHKSTFRTNEALSVESSQDPSVSRSAPNRADSYTRPQNVEHETGEPDQVRYPGQTQGGDAILAHTALRSHPPNGTIPLKSALKSKHSSQAKMDSGYCSSASTGVEAGQVPEMDPLNLSKSDPAANLSLKGDEVHMLALEDEPKVSSAFVPSQKLTQKPSASASQPASRELEKGKEQESPEESERPTTERKKSWKKSIRRSLSRSQTAEITPNRNSPASIPGSSNSLESTKPKKLQKKRPLSQPPLLARDYHNLTDEVPRVPSSVFAKFSERLTTTPGLQHLDRTYEDAKSTNPRGRSTSPARISAVPPVLGESYFPDAQQNVSTATASSDSKRANATDKAAPRPPAHRHGLSRMSFRRPSTSQRKEEELESERITGISDFGTVAQSLGSGPYDIAKSNQPQRPRSAVVGHVQYPHQLGAHQGNYGPREGWDAETASRFAQMRSRERAAATAAAEKESVSSRRPPVSNRPKSYHEDSPVQQPRQSMNQRPKSVHGSVPQAREYASKRDQLHDQYIMLQGNQRPSIPVTAATHQRPRTANEGAMGYDEGSSQQESRSPITTRSSGWLPQHRTSAVDPAVHDHASRSQSPVKKMVSVLEARAALAPTPSPTPRSPTVDWSEQSRMWRERKMNAEEVVRTTSSDYSESVTSTTTSTMATYIPGSGNSTVQSSHWSTPIPTTTTRTVRSPLPSNTTTHTSYLSTPVSRTSVNHTCTVSSTSSSRISPVPTYSQQQSTSTPMQPRSREQPRGQSRYHANPAPGPRPDPMQQQPLQMQRPQSKRISSGGVFGRFSGGPAGDQARLEKPVVLGKKRDTTPRTQAIRSGYGVDFGDIPVRSAPI